jgi:7,8-dihydropterin-6-yl-methyl-4-(beta-D-ribofuranosyl)aminobenzene 5'-phosphate synthase
LAKTVALKEVCKLELVALMDNNVDFLSRNAREEVQSFRDWTKRRYGESWANRKFDLPFAEHGFSVLVRVFSEESNGSILFDTGVSSNGVVANAERMGIHLGEISIVALSHGHYDHFGGLVSVAKAANRIGLPVIIHGDMVRRRGTVNAEGDLREHPPFPNLKQLDTVELVHTRGPYLIANDYACVTGEIPRTVCFEKGSTRSRIFRDRSWQPDAFLDERALVLNLKNRGLIVISGCAHAGIVNTVAYAQRISGVDRVCAVIGGFHLASLLDDERVELTIKELRLIGPEFIVPSHCSGWRAMCNFARAFPKEFVWNSVGSLYDLQ